MADEIDVVKAFVKLLGDDPNREGLRETPQRVLAAWKEWTSGYNQKPEDILKTFEDGAENYDELVFEGNIPLFSTCMHHLATFFGVAHIGYIPNGRIIGLSKLARLVDIFSKRLTVQETITTQVANALNEGLQPKAVGVVLRCRHLCIESRGVKKPGTITMTASMLGAFKDEPDARAEFLTYVQMADSKATI